eukprot:gene2594-3214_t
MIQNNYPGLLKSKLVHPKESLLLDYSTLESPFIRSLFLCSAVDDDLELCGIIYQRQLDFLLNRNIFSDISIVTGGKWQLVVKNRAVFDRIIHLFQYLMDKWISLTEDDYDTVLSFCDPDIDQQLISDLLHLYSPIRSNVLKYIFRIGHMRKLSITLTSSTSSTPPNNNNNNNTCFGYFGLSILSNDIKIVESVYPRYELYIQQTFGKKIDLPDSILKSCNKRKRSTKLFSRPSSLEFLFTRIISDHNNNNSNSNGSNNKISDKLYSVLSKYIDFKKYFSPDSPYQYFLIKSLPDLFVLEYPAIELQLPFEYQFLQMLTENRRLDLIKQIFDLELFKMNCKCCNNNSNNNKKLKNNNSSNNQQQQQQQQQEEEEIDIETRFNNFNNLTIKEEDYNLDCLKVACENYHFKVVKFMLSNCPFTTPGKPLKISNLFISFGFKAIDYLISNQFIQLSNNNIKNNNRNQQYYHLTTATPTITKILPPADNLDMAVEYEVSNPVFEFIFNNISKRFSSNPTKIVPKSLKIFKLLVENKMNIDRIICPREILARYEFNEELYSLMRHNNQKLEDYLTPDDPKSLVLSKVNLSTLKFMESNDIPITNLILLNSCFASRNFEATKYLVVIKSLKFIELILDPLITHPPNQTVDHFLSDFLNEIHLRSVNLDVQTYFYINFNRVVLKEFTNLKFDNIDLVKILIYSNGCFGTLNNPSRSDQFQLKHYKQLLWDNINNNDIRFDLFYIHQNLSPHFPVYDALISDLKQHIITTKYFRITSDYYTYLFNLHHEDYLNKMSSFTNEELEIINLSLGYFRSQAIVSIINIGVANQIPIGDSRSIFDIARQLEVNPEFLYRTMRAVSVLGIFKEDDQKHGHFSHTPLSKCLIKQGGVADSIKFLVHKMTYLGWSNLENSIRTGKGTGAARFHGIPTMWSLIESDAQYRDLFQNAMSSLTMNNLSVIQGTDFKPYHTVVDLGGSYGGILMEILKLNPHLKGINFDLSPVIEKSKQLIIEKKNPSLQYDESVLSRFSQVGGNFLESVPPSDCYIIKSVLHNWNDQSAKTILSNIHRSMSPNGNLIIYDLVMDYKSLPPNFPFLFMDLHMMMMVDGKERDFKDWSDLIGQCGFKIESISKIDKIYSRIILSKK